MDRSTKGIIILSLSLFGGIALLLYDMIIMRDHVDRELLIMTSNLVLICEIVIIIWIAIAFNIVFPGSKRIKILSLCFVGIFGMLLYIEWENRLYQYFNESMIWAIILIILYVFVIGLFVIELKYPGTYKKLLEDYLRMG